MQNYGFIKVAAAVPVVTPTNSSANSDEIITLIQQAAEAHVEIVCFPELSITGYTCGDLFHSSVLQQSAERALERILSQTQSLSIVSIVGVPIAVGNNLYNCAVVIKSGKIVAVVPKTHIPNYDEFYEQRWFTSATNNSRSTITLCGQSVPFGTDLLIQLGDLTFGIEICEDLWTPVPQCNLLALAGAQIVFNLSASDAIAGKHAHRKELLRQHTARCFSGYVYASAGFGESSTDLVFDGAAIIADNGEILAESKRFALNSQLVISDIDIEQLTHQRQKNQAYMQGAYISNADYRIISVSRASMPFELTRQYPQMPFCSDESALDSQLEEMFSIQANALAIRLKHIHVEHVIVGVSGGLDSTLALLVCLETFERLGIDKRNIIGITMPGFGTTRRTKNNADSMMKQLGITTLTIPIAKACRQHFRDIGHDEHVTDLTYENTQARERTQILMDLCSKHNAIVIGTGDMSELALGWATYNGDHMSMYAVNTGVPKTFVRLIVDWVARHKSSAKVARVLQDVLDTPISPELLPADAAGKIAQKTEDLVGPYELHDFFMYHTMRNGFAPTKIQYLAEHAFAPKYDSATIHHWLRTFTRRFFTQQFKRSCMPDGPKVGAISLSPRGDWRMPSDASAADWLNELQ